VLAGFGADVIKAEPPGGSAPGSTARSIPTSRPHSPACVSTPSTEAQRCADLDKPGGRADFLALVASADFLFENPGPGAMDASVSFDVAQCAS
jgi:crotonobetainyl-CoA:carnitine CoA-transferase CaiB-like acyl-CoA transferase